MLRHFCMVLLKVLMPYLKTKCIILHSRFLLHKIITLFAYRKFSHGSHRLPTPPPLKKIPTQKLKPLLQFNTYKHPKLSMNNRYNEGSKTMKMYSPKADRSRIHEKQHSRTFRQTCLHSWRRGGVGTGWREGYILTKKKRKRRRRRKRKKQTKRQ